jgi:transposase InsO family protein
VTNDGCHQIAWLCTTSDQWPGIARLVSKARGEPRGKGLDHGPHTRLALKHHHHRIVPPATNSRHLHSAGLVQPSPQKRPKTFYVRFAAEQPNERWQADFTHWWLADGTHVEILDWLDDHARYALSVTAHHRVTGELKGVRTVLP